MKYDLRVMNTKSKDGPKYVCHSWRSPLGSGFKVTGVVSFKNDEEMRNRLEGILPSSDIESSIYTFRERGDDNIFYESIELTDVQAESLGCAKQE